ncbi:MAG TPA: hypothetical protein VJ914_13310 [Pseudonocardiaceae bacterium]|nr:hypothetical protein [Pseudonocardiaceae bacterium]
MNEDDMRDLLGTALHGEPRNAIDPARLMRLGKRKVRIQRASAALGVMVLAGGIALGASLLHPGKGQPGRIGTAGTPSSSVLPLEPTTGPDSIPVTPQAPPVLPNAQQVLQRQDAALAKAYPLPSATLASSGAYAFTPSRPVSNGYAGSNLHVQLTDASGSGELTMSVLMVSGRFGGAMTCAGSLMNCTVRLVGGLTVEVETDHPTAHATRILTVAFNKKGNVLVNAEVDNLLAKDSKTVTRSAPPLTADQLAIITASVAEATY